MAPKRNGTLNSLGTSDSLSPNLPSTLPGLARSPSPSFTQFLTKPTKWFTRSASTSKVPATTAESKTLATSGSGRKHKISRPTDPRPILDVYGNNASSRSVLDLSQRAQNSFDLPRFPHAPSTPSSPTISSSGAGSGGGGLGDLRNISKRGWSKSADDLSKTSAPIAFSPVHASFQERVAEYRGRSDSLASAVSTGSPTSPSSIRHPFPTLATTPPSSSSPPSLVSPRPAAPRSSTLPTLSVSISSPVMEDSGSSPKGLTPTHIHTRSHSFTPKLPSKLATPTYPSSPSQGSQHGYGGGFTSPPLEISNSGRHHASPSSPPKTTVLSGSPGAKHRSTTLLSPPTIIEPPSASDGKEERDYRRASQVLVHSGFINRLADVPANLHTGTAQFSKGWKPYKMELKGSKLHFYKPPSDRTNAVKDLFPTGLVPPSQEDEEVLTIMEEDADAGGGAEEGKRAKGRDDGGTHPDLMQDGEGKIVKGTFEALTHEAAFGTTFEEADDEWKEFASSVLFALPGIAGRGSFEQEFLRCCSYLVSGAEDEFVEKEKDRVTWLANEYLRQHGMPVDSAAWVEWKEDTIPDVDLGAESYSTSTTSGMPSSTSTQAIYTNSPMAEGSPEFTTFSPRPENGSKKFVPLLDALNGFTLPTGSFGGPQARSSRIPWQVLHEEGLTRDLLVQLDPFLLSQSLTLYHRSVLEQTSDLNNPENLSPSLFGTEDDPHWLTKLILLQIFEGNTPQPQVTSPLISHSVQSPGRKSEDRLGAGGSPAPPLGASTSRTHSRSEIISTWAKIGELCRRGGDECSWKAIAAALCSRPVSRLEKAWKRVDPQALTVVESWVYPSSAGDKPSPSLRVNDPQFTPWAGDLRKRLGEELAKARGDNGGEETMLVEGFKQAKGMYDGFRNVYALCPRNAVISEDEVGADVRRMVAFWRDVAEGGRTSGMAIKFQRVDQFMSLSLAAESRRKGLFEPYFWQRQQMTQSPNAVLIPLLFPEPLPTQTLVDRNQILRGRVDSDAMEVQQYLRSNSNDSRLAGQHPLQRLDINPGFTKKLIFGQTGPVISVYNGDLLLMVQPGGSDSVPPSRTPSRPPSSSAEHTVGVMGGAGAERTSVSRAPSIRVKPNSSHELSRKASVARRSSLPSVSHHRREHNPMNYVIPEHSSDPPLRVIVQAGALDNLVSVLVYGLGHISVSVADDNGEMTLREGMTRELVVDRVEYARTWWSSFRSFVTPLVFFELLRKLYITSQPAGSSPQVEEYLNVASRRNEVLATMKEWVSTGGGAQDLLDDVQLYTSLQSFLDSPTDHIVHKALAFDETDVQEAWQGVDAAREGLRACFISQTMRPALSGVHNQIRATGGTNGVRARHTAPRDPPDLDRMDPEDFVDNLDGMACAAFGNVTEEDLYITADLLEVQSSDKTGWFSSREPAATEEATEIQCLYSYIQEVEPSSLIPETSQDVLYRLLPPGIRSCIRAFAIIRKWLVSKIVAPRLGLRTRQTRMELLIQAIEVARLRSAENPGSNPLSASAAAATSPTSAGGSAANALLQPCVRSFVEAVVTSALLSVESRMHHRAWQSVALSRGCQGDSLASMLLRPYVQTTTSKDTLTVDVGWLLERMLEVIAGPDVLDAASQEGHSLVNFDKRRHLYNLINKAWALPSSRKHPQSDEANRRGFERLNNIEKEVFHLQFDHRGIREEAAREATQTGGNGHPSSKKTIRPFYKVVATQIEKNRRDRNLRSRLQREKIMEQSRNERRDDILNRAMKGPRSKTQPLVNAVQKQHRNKKSMSAFLNFMRPISSAFGADITPASNGPMYKKTAAELDFVPSGKAALVLSILDARAAQFINNERSYMFQLETEDGGHYLLQATSKKDMAKWLEIISKVTQSVAQRRLTYLGNSPKPQIADHIHDQANTPSRDPMAVFGVELEYLLQREALGGDIPPGTVPHIIEACLMEIETRGLTEVGIYRIAGATLEINALKEAFNRGDTPVSSSTDIHAVCDLVKSWFRVLPEPVFPPDSYYEVMEAMKVENLEDRLAGIRAAVQGLPQANFDLLRRVAEHLDRVTECEEHNHMTAEALAIVFSPNLLRAPQNNFAMILNNMGLSHKLVKAFITHFHVIFDESDPEAEEIQSEEEEEEENYEAPIPEEDEGEYEEEQDQEEEEEGEVGYGYQSQLAAPQLELPDNLSTSDLLAEAEEQLQQTHIRYQ
ncbi:rho GTPase activating protein 22 [Ephemerocybe angulata]|uniref:Rho GTPase activating protein 22 n=1 Tax=Ephemerocybe angulata TaxID=980116 RepID=A0A8H6HUY6_9AGAR|nr:rho GTPase activating protein 22 [Tulosesus angulatus]